MDHGSTQRERPVIDCFHSRSFNDQPAVKTRLGCLQPHWPSCTSINITVLNVVFLWSFAKLLQIGHASKWHWSVSKMSITIQRYYRHSNIGGPAPNVFISPVVYLCVPNVVLLCLPFRFWEEPSVFHRDVFLPVRGGPAQVSGEILYLLEPCRNMLRNVL